MVPALMDAAGVEPSLRASLARALDRKDSAAVAALVQGQPGALAALPGLMAATGPADGALAALEAADLPPAARAIAAATRPQVLAAIQARAPALRITLDPVEFRGFRYHTGVAFTLYGPGMSGELARGGRYVSQNDEPATGMTLYPDAVLRAAPADRAEAAAVPAARRRWRGRSVPRASRRSPHSRPRTPPQRLRCTHELKDGRPVPILTKD